MPLCVFDLSLSPTPVHGHEGGEGSGRRGSAVLLLHQAVAKSGAKDRPPAPLAEGIVAEIRYTHTTA